MYFLTRTLQEACCQHIKICHHPLCDHSNGPLARYAKLRVAHAPGMPGTFSPPPTSKETASYRSRHASQHMHHACAVMHVEIANPRWRGTRSRHFRRMPNPQFYVSGKTIVACQGWFHFTACDSDHKVIV